MEVLLIKIVVVFLVLIMAIWAMGYLPIIPPDIKNLLIFVFIALAAIYVAKIGGLF